MVNRLFEIQVNSSELNKDLGFEVLEGSGLSVMCLEDERYVITEEAIKLLRDRGVMYKVLTINGETLKNATEVKD